MSASRVLQLLLSFVPNAGELTPDLVHEVDVYTTEPFNLDRRYFVNGEKNNEGFFFTPRRPTSNKPSDAHRVHRMVGISGKWFQTRKETPIKDPETGRPIVHKNTFAFKLNHGVTSKDSFKNNWIMHEYSIDYSIDRSQDLALCVIYRMEMEMEMEPKLLQEIKKVEDGIGVDINQALARNTSQQSYLMAFPTNQDVVLFNFDGIAAVYYRR